MTIWGSRTIFDAGNSQDLTADDRNETCGLLSLQGIINFEITIITRKDRENKHGMKYIKITAVLFFAIMISVVPYGLYQEHILAGEIERRNAAGEQIMHEGFELVFLFGYGLYSILFLLWTAHIYFKVTAENAKRRVFELIAILILGVLPAVGVVMLFSRI